MRAIRGVLSTAQGFGVPKETRIEWTVRYSSEGVSDRVYARYNDKQVAMYVRNQLAADKPDFIWDVVLEYIEVYTEDV